MLHFWMVYNFSSVLAYHTLSLFLAAELLLRIRRFSEFISYRHVTVL